MKEDKKEEYEIRYFFHGELACPNPTEYYKATRSYEDMRREYDLLTCDKVTQEDIIEAMLDRGVKYVWF